MAGERGQVPVWTMAPRAGHGPARRPCQGADALNGEEHECTASEDMKEQSLGLLAAKLLVQSLRGLVTLFGVGE